MIYFCCMVSKTPLLQMSDQFANCCAHMAPASVNGSIWLPVAFKRNSLNTFSFFVSNSEPWLLQLNRWGINNSVYLIINAIFHLVIIFGQMRADNWYYDKEHNQLQWKTPILEWPIWYQNPPILYLQDSLFLPNEEYMISKERKKTKKTWGIV